MRVTLTDGRVTTGMLSNGEISRLNGTTTTIVRAAGMQAADLTLLHQDRVVRIEAAQDTGRFPAYMDLYMNMIEMQLTYDALRIIEFDMALMQTMGGEMVFMQQLAHAGKIAQGIFVARKKK